MIGFGTTMSKKTTIRTNHPGHSWAEQYLADRGIEVGFAKANHVKLYEERIAFEYRHPLTGEQVNTNTRHMVPPIDPKTGKAMKFTRRRGLGGTLYYPSHWGWKDIFADSSIPIFIVESECSALALAQHGLVAIGTGGKDCVFMSGTKRQRLHQDFDLMVLRRREVYLAFDGDATTQPSVQESIDAAAKLFTEAAR